MDIKELETYRLSDAVKFNDTLNPRLWGSDENLLPEVREKLLAIANDFREFLGVPDLRVQDITVSGSNAAYTYTPHSDIDLHLVVDLPEDAVYRELFDAKKYQYNNQHNIKIAGYDVELYVQPAGDTHHSQGIYSVKNSDWISVPQRRHPEVDDISVQSKYEDIGHRIEQAIKSGDLAQIVAVAKKVKQMRQAGLDQTGEFGPENLAFKALRSNGTLDQMRAALQAAQDRQLSLDEQQRNKTKKKHHYGRVGGMWLPGYEYMTTAPEIANESQDRGQIRDTIKQFARSCFKQYGLKNPPKLRIQHNPAWTERNGTFGRFDPDTNSIELAVTGRHMIDILRTLAHELTHAKQNEQGEMPDDAGRTGSPYEDAANAQAGRMMRHWAEQHPDQFKDVKLDEATGYIPVNSREAQDPRYSMALTVDIKPGEVQRQAAKMGWKTDAAGRPPLLMAFQNQLASSKQTSTALTESVEAIVEGATDVLYHMTSTRSAANILADGVFKLASSVGTKAEEKYAPPDRPYFLSTSRSKAGDYSRYVGTSAVMFDLNGQWISQRYQVKPIDYWDRAWLNNPERTSESEDRVFSKDPEISIACVTSVHALIKTADEWRSPYTRQVLLLAKQRGIPAYLYTDPKAWKLQDTRNAVSPQQASALLKGSVPVRPQYKPASSYLEPWLELIHKKAKSELSPKAEKLRHNLVYYGLRYPNEDGGLADDMNNSRKPDSPDYANVAKLIKFMRANRLAKPADLKNALAQKWDAINTKERESAKAQEPVAEDTLDEIERLPKAGYVGGKSTLKQNPEYVKQTQLPTAKPLPGGSGLLYGIEIRNYQTIVRIYDPETNQPIGALKLYKLEKGQWPIQPAYQVDTITTDEDYQGQSIAKSLYGIVLTIMRATLLAGTQQTPGGRALWVRLTKGIRGVEVTGYLTVSDLDLTVDTSSSPKDNPSFTKMMKALARNAEKTIDSIQSLGAQYIGEIKDDWHPRSKRRVYQFPVTVDITTRGEEVANADKASKIAIYNNFIPKYNSAGKRATESPWETGLMARWLG